MSKIPSRTRSSDRWQMPLSMMQRKHDLSRACRGTRVPPPPPRRLWDPARTPRHDPEDWHFLSGNKRESLGCILRPKYIVNTSPYRTGIYSIEISKENAALWVALRPCRFSAILSSYPCCYCFYAPKWTKSGWKYLVSTSLSWNLHTSVLWHPLEYQNKYQPR